MTDKYRNVELVCSICGCNDFVFDQNYEEMQDDQELKCADCGHIYTKAELIEENQSRIDANINEMIDDTLKDLKKEIKKAFRKVR